MRCQVCSAEVPSDALFCQHCGTKLPLDASSASKDAATPAPKPPERPSRNADPAATMGRVRAVADVPEETLWEGQYSPKAMIGPALGALLLSLAFAVAGALLGYWIVWLPLIGLVWLALFWLFSNRRLGVHYKMTNQMFYHRRGVITRTIDRIEAIDIDDVTWQQGLLERLVNVGSIRISSRDRTDPVFWLFGIEGVEHVSRVIDKARRAERLRRGFLSIEQTNVDLGT